MISEHPVEHGENYSIYLHGKVRDRLKRKERKGHENIFGSLLKKHVLLSSFKKLNLIISALKCFEKSCYQYSIENQQICKPLIKPVPMSIIKIGTNFTTVYFIFCVCLATCILLSVDEICISKAKNRSVHVVDKKQTRAYRNSLLCNPL